MAFRVKKPAATVRIYYLVFHAKGAWFWQLQLNGRTIAQSADGFATRELAVAGARLVRKHAGSAEIDAVAA